VHQDQTVLREVPVYLAYQVRLEHQVLLVQLDQPEHPALLVLRDPLVLLVLLDPLVLLELLVVREQRGRLERLDQLDQVVLLE